MLRRLAAEGLGTALLLAVIVGSGIMAQSLAPDAPGLALLANSIATGTALFGLITFLGPISGAHLNPVVTLVAVWSRDISWRAALLYGPSQMIGAIGGVWLAHLMFAEPMLQVSTHLRSGPGQGLSEIVATFGLVLTILGTTRARPGAVAAVVALYIVAAYWFTASTSFANPAVTIARALTDTFTGIAPSSVLPFILAQILGGSAAAMTGHYLFPRAEPA